MLDTKVNIEEKSAKRQRRKTIPDACITIQQYESIIFKIATNLSQSDKELSQKNIITTAMKFNLSNKMISNIINYLLPESKATSGSVASMIKFIRNQEKKSKEFARLLEWGLAHG